MLVDSHCHLDFPEFAEDLDDVVARARAAGVGVMQTICTRMSGFEQVHAVARRFDGIYCSLGVHPHNVADEGIVSADDICEKAGAPEVIGIGETGLDFHYEHSPREEQAASFREHIGAARATGLPVIVHTRNADDETMEILEDEMARGSFPGLIHCFSASRRLAERSLALGFAISISGIATFRKADELRDIVATIPLDSLLVETDAPFLAPVPRRGKRNEPAFVTHTAACVAEILGVSGESLARATTRNFFRLFSKARDPAVPGGGDR